MVSFGFFNSSNGDRRYSSEDISRIFSFLITDGVLMTYGDKFFTTPSTSNLGVILGTGWAWFNHTWTMSDAKIPFALSEADPSLDRIDTIYLKVDARSLGRVNSLGLLEGSPALNPKAPTFPTETDVYYHPLAYIRVRKNVTRIAASDIEILAGKTQAPFITSILQSTDITTLFQGWSEQFGRKMTEWENELDTLETSLTSNVDALISRGNQQLSTQQSQFTAAQTARQNTFNTSITGWETEFRTWFDNLQTYLSQDVVTAIWADLDKLKNEKVNVSDKANSSEATASQGSGSNDTKWMTPLKTLNFYEHYTASSSETMSGSNNLKHISPLTLEKYFLSASSGYMAILITTSGTWDIPADADANCYAILVGGGGGGGNGYPSSGSTTNGGGGGGSGHVAKRLFRITPSSGSFNRKLRVAIGAGGSYTANGGDTKLYLVYASNGSSTILSAGGGSGGGSGTSSRGGDGGTGMSGGGGGGGNSSVTYGRGGDTNPMTAASMSGGGGGSGSGYTGGDGGNASTGFGGTGGARNQNGSSGVWGASGGTRGGSSNSGGGGGGGFGIQAIGGNGSHNSGLSKGGGGGGGGYRAAGGAPDYCGEGAGAGGSGRSSTGIGGGGAGGYIPEMFDAYVRSLYPKRLSQYTGTNGLAILYIPETWGIGL